MEETNVANVTNSQHERIDDVWKKTMELDLKLSALTESVKQLSESMKELTSKIEEMKTTLDELQVIEEEESSSDESNETVKVEIVTTPETPQEQMQPMQQTPKSMIKKILLG